MDDAHIKRLRRAVAATPDDANAQAELNAALSRMDIVRTLVHGHWREAPRVFDAQGVEIVGTSERIVSVTLRDASLAELLADGRYDSVDEAITPDRFAVEASNGSRSLELVAFRDPVFAGDSLNWLAVNGLRPATIKELLVFSAARFELEPDLTIAALGSTCFLYTHGLVPVLYERLSLYLFIRRWGIDCRFLAVRIEPPSAASQDVIADLPGTSAD